MDAGNQNFGVEGDRTPVLKNPSTKPYARVRVSTLPAGACVRDAPARCNFGVASPGRPTAHALALSGFIRVRYLERSSGLMEAQAVKPCFMLLSERPFQAARRAASTLSLAFVRCPRFYGVSGVSGALFVFFLPSRIQYDPKTARRRPSPVSRDRYPRDQASRPML